MSEAGKVCRECGLVWPLADFGERRATCRRCRNLKARSYYTRNRAQVLRRQKAGRDSSNAWIRYKYGLTTEQMTELLVEQRGLCAICGRAGAELVVDHCHLTGVVRGLLCSPCNRALGHFIDAPWVCRAAALYLQR
jgi:hypothetical protein